MILTLTTQEFQFLQQYLNEMFQSDTLRSGPMGGLITGLRNKFLTFGSIDLTEVERGFLLFSLQDTFQTSQSPIVTSQLGNSMRLLGERQTKIVSSISQLNTPASDQSQGTYLKMWDVMTNVMTKLGLAEPPPYEVPKEGPLGEPLGINPGRPNVNPDDRMQ